MKTFRDNAGRTWSVCLNISAIKRVRDLAGVDLLEAVGGRLLEKLTTDPVLLCDVLYAVCRDEAENKSVSDEDFGCALAGDAVEHATTALLEELVDFFPQARRQVLGKALEKMKALQERALKVANTRLDSPELERAMEQALAESGPASGSLPALSGPIPAT